MKPIFSLCFLLCITVAAFAQATNIPVSELPTDVADTLSPLLNLLGGESGLLAAIVAWMGAIRVPMKLVNSHLQSGLTKTLIYVASTPETDDDSIVVALLGSKVYRLMAFSSDLLLSLKLPNQTDFRALLKTP